MLFFFFFSLYIYTSGKKKKKKKNREKLSCVGREGTCDIFGTGHCNIVWPFDSWVHIYIVYKKLLKTDLGDDRYSLELRFFFFAMGRVDAHYSHTHSLGPRIIHISYILIHPIPLTLYLPPRLLRICPGCNYGSD